MRHLLLFILSILLSGGIHAQGHVEDQPLKRDTSYILIPPISESCKNIVFTDSMFRAWNAASIENIKSSLLKNSNGCLEWLIPQFVKGENYRLSFGKVLNNDSLITKEDFKEGFFIIEEMINGEMVYKFNYVIANKENMLKVYRYRFNNIDVAWDFTVKREINKRKFHHLFNKIKRCKKNESIYPTMEFIVSKFSEGKVESFVFTCKGCDKYTMDFDHFIEKFKISR